MVKSKPSLACYPFCPTTIMLVKTRSVEELIYELETDVVEEGVFYDYGVAMQLLLKLALNINFLVTIQL